ncbi:ATP-binding protein [Streptomyces sp. W16]|uniref:AAA family ATPase n=1 Tax=Streptomyces sp. W16 TaxID=3076631 RepID=UPI00295BE7F7|nr:ATP-binding protein [Streptomyces sp. W16]MDV9171974.1 ATP-binding protein [Streptomyces sp. W16]
MARADLLLQLVQAALTRDERRVKSSVEALASEERAKRHTVLADELVRLLRQTASMEPVTPGTNSKSDGYTEVHPKRRLSDLCLPDAVLGDLESLIEEQHRADLLRAYNIEPRHRVLLIGPPGNGKTSTAEALAAELAVPLLVLRYETVITSYLGETSLNIEKVFEEARSRHCVLFLDEFDTLAKERGDEHDTGEVKRVVSNLLMQIDQLPSHAIVCAATNHSELLDRAVWRRFQLKLEFPNPTRDQRTYFAQELRERLGMVFGRSSRTIIDKLGPISYAEIEDFFLELRRRQILSGDLEGTDDALLVRTLTNWEKRARSVHEGG